MRATVACLALGAATAAAPARAHEAADLVLTDARIYTEDPAHSSVEAMAVRDGRIVFLGTSRQAAEWIGSRTRVERLDGRRVLPGLVDAHIHASMIGGLDSCDLKGRQKSLREIAAFARACIERDRVPPGEWLVVHQWDYAKGNEPDPKHPTLRAALDEASHEHPIELRGNDGHHSAFNGVALARGKNKEGRVVGLSGATLERDFAELKPFVGVDEQGEPSGAVNEEARRVLDNPDWLLADLPKIMRAGPERITRRLNSAGITAILDAYVPPGLLPFYDALEQSGELTVWTTLAQYYDPELNRGPDGRVDYDAMVAQASAIRAKYSADPLIRADAVKLFADGGLEGNPYAVPPTLPNAALLRPFLQPIFARDPSGRATVAGYVDTGSTLCADVRANAAQYGSRETIARFIDAHGFHPQQCDIYSGRLYHDPEVIREFVRRFHLAGFALHIHVISDQGLRVSLDALEAARAADGNRSRDVLAHLQLAHPDDIARLGRDRLFVAFTYAWAYADPQYDMTVIPFIDRVKGNRYRDLHFPGAYYDANAYPFRAVRQAGGTLIAGSDAPVDTPDPRPFVNMAHAITRRNSGQPPLNSEQSITVRDVLDAYTINGARALGRERDFGSLEPGKSADFIVLDRDILALAEQGRPAAIAQAHVRETWFQGRRVYPRALLSGRSAGTGARSPRRVPPA